MYLSQTVHIKQEQDAEGYEDVSLTRVSDGEYTELETGSQKIVVNTAGLASAIAELDSDVG